MKAAMAFLFLLVCLPGPGTGFQDTGEPLDKRVNAFLEEHRSSWYQMNVPWVDGKTLYDLIVKHRYTHALEIGTSTGHSTIWLAWAMSKTGGRVVTIEIDPGRYREARENLERAGLLEYVDTRLADAHDLVPRLEGEFDFVFCDADKHWYTNYLKAVLPKLLSGGCFTAHNVGSRWQRGISDFLEYLESESRLTTTIDRKSRAGLSISFKN